MSKLNFQSGKILSLNDANDIYIEIELVLLTNVVNLNKARFTDDFISNVVDNKDKYSSIPIVADFEKLENKDYKNLTHLYKNGTFGTHVIGALCDFYQQSLDDGSLALCGKARIYKRFPAICEAVIELFESEELKFSVEALVGKYVKQSGYREIPADENNELISTCVISNPAEIRSKAYTLIAEAMVQDFNGGDNVDLEKYFEKANLASEISEVDLNQLRTKIYAQLREMYNEDDDFWKYDLAEIGLGYLILSDYQTGDIFKIEYTLSETDDSLTFSEMQKVIKRYLPAEFDVNLSELKGQVEQLTQELETVKAELETAKNELAAKDTTISEKDTSIEELNFKITELNENIIALGETVKEKDSEIASLLPFKEKVEQAELEKAEKEKAEKISQLKERCSKLLSEEEMASEEVSQLIESFEVDKINAILAEKALEMFAKKPETQKRITDQVKTESDLMSKYVTRN